MGSYLAGSTIKLGIEFRDPADGSLKVPDDYSIKVSIYKDGNLIRTSSTEEILTVTGGKYEFYWTTDENLEPGIYVYVWEAKFDEKPVKNDGLLRIRRKKLESS